MILYCGSEILLLFCVMPAMCQFDVEPQNVLVKVGDSVVLECTVTGAGQPGNIQVWREFYSSQSGSTISSDATVMPGYETEFDIVSGSKYNLRLKNGQSGLKHGGQFQCDYPIPSPPPTKKAELIVLETDPKFNEIGPSNPGGIIIEGALVTYTCEIRYQGRWAPTMSWTRTDGHNVNPVNQSTDGITKFTLEFKAGINDNDQAWSCRTHFTTLDPPPGQNEATNIPNYDKTMISQNLVVHYSPRNTLIQDMKGNPISNGTDLYPGDTIRCITQSNPAVTCNNYEWRNGSDSNILARTEIITIDVSWIGELSLTCLVRNYMGADGNTIGQDISQEIIVSVKTTTTIPTTTKLTATTAAEVTSESCICMEDSKIDAAAAAIVGGILGSLLTIVCIVFSVFILRVYNPVSNNKGNSNSPDNKPTSSAYQNVDISQEKPERRMLTLIGMTTWNSG